MGLKETINDMQKHITALSKDLIKAGKGNKAASQRARTGSIKLAKLAKHFRKESVQAEKSGAFKKFKGVSKKKPSKKRICAPCKRKPAKRAKKRSRRR